MIVCAISTFFDDTTSKQHQHITNKYTTTNSCFAQPFSRQNCCQNRDGKMAIGARFNLLAMNNRLGSKIYLL